MAQDASGAVVPGAKVEAVNKKTASIATATTDAEGRFSFPSLVPSEYVLTVEAAGFRKSVKENLVLNVAETVREIVRLEVGQVADSVVVEANAVRVQTTDGQVANSITLREIELLPQLGRDPIILAIFNTGVQIDVANGTSYSRVNGTRQGSNNATLDGIESNDPVAPRLGLSMVSSTTDTVEEFRVVTNGGKAEYGRNSGGQVQMISRSGTNTLHGGAWDYLRNTTLNANNFFNNSSGQPRPTYIRNIFGGRVDGPIRKDRTFFMGSYEGNRTRQQVVRNRTVLIPEAKRGLFLWNTSAGRQSWDIVKNDPRGKGIDPSVKKMLDLLPDPNNFDIGDSLTSAGYRFNAPANSYNDMFTGKVDHNISSVHRAFFRLSWQRNSSIDTTNGYEARFPTAENGTQGGHRLGWSAGSDWTLTSTLVNEFRLGGMKYNTDFNRVRTHEAMISPTSYLNPVADPTGFSQGRTVPYVELTDNLTKVLGKHTFKAGINMRFTTQDAWREDYAWPTIYFSRSYGNAPAANVGPSGNSTDRTRFENLYNDLLGRVSSVMVRYYSDLATYQQAGTRRDRKFRYREYAGFLQDDWRVSPRLTLNLGLRYEFFGVPFEANGFQGNFDQVSAINYSAQITNLKVAKGSAYYNPDRNNFAPRFAFAWDPFGKGKTVIRGGAGIFYDRMINAVLTPADTSTPGFSSDVTVYPNSSGTTDVRLSDGMPALPQPATPLLELPLTRAQSVTVIQPNIRTGYVVHTNLWMEREILRNTVLEAGYVGTRGIKLFMHENVNQPRIYEDFLTAFKQLQAYRSSKTPVPAGNTLVRIFGSADAAVAAVTATTLDSGSVGVAVNNVDTTSGNYGKYAAAGVPATYIRNYPQYSYLYLGTNDGRSYYNSLQVRMRRRMGALHLTANYTLSKSMDNWADEGNGTDGGSSIDWFNNRLNRGRSDFDHRHSFNMQASYRLPFGKKRRFFSSAPGWLDAMVGGWALGALNYWQSGNVFSVSSGRATGPNPGTNTFADYNGDRNIGEIDKRGNGVYYFASDVRSTFTYPTAGTTGTSARNTFRGPRHFNIDTNLSKRFRVYENHSVTFRAEAYNLLNNVNFGTPSAAISSSSSFGKFGSTIGSSRIVQAALRYEF